jgi:hypothetical protein
VDAVTVVVGGRSADAFAVGEALVVVDEPVQPVEPVFVGAFVGEPGVVGA